MADYHHSNRSSAERNQIAIGPLHAAVMRNNLLDQGIRCEVARGLELVHEGSAARDAFLVLDGSARVTARGRLVTRLGPGDFVGEIALLDGGRRSASVTADSAMRVLVFDAPAFAALLEDPAFCRILLRALAARVRSATTTTTTVRNPQ
jgi:CRP/FNR family cyclic AMP-dependent transcriptional regulator